MLNKKMLILSVLIFTAVFLSYADYPYNDFQKSQDSLDRGSSAWNIGYSMGNPIGFFDAVRGLKYLSSWSSPYNYPNGPEMVTINGVGYHTAGIWYGLC